MGLREHLAPALGCTAKRSMRGEAATHIVASLKEQAAFFARSSRQNGFTTTRITIAIINNVGTSLMIRQCLAGLSFRSPAKRRTAADK